MNKITATEDKQGLKVEVKGELGFAIATTREILKGIAQVGPNEVTGFTAALSTIIETALMIRRTDRELQHYYIESLEVMENV